MPINVNFKTKNIEVTEDIKQYTAKRISKLEQFVDDDDTSAIADVELEKETDQRSGEIYRAEINLKIAGEFLRAEAQTADLREAIDVAQEEMIREVKKAKGKRRTLLRNGARKMKKMIRGWYTNDNN